jgi:predicted transcriptional regulator
MFSESGGMQTARYLFVLWVSVLLVSASLAIAAYWAGAGAGAGSTQRPQLWLEVFKFALGLVQVVVIGGAAALLLEQYKQSQLQAKDRDARRRELIAETRRVYNAIKKARRLLRDHVGESDDVRGEWMVAHRVALGDFGRSLIDAQLDLEHLAEQTGRPSKYADSRTLSELFDVMESRLNHISEAMRKASTGDVAPPQAELIRKFLYDGFRDDFKLPYHAAIDKLTEPTPLPPRSA